MTPNEGLLTGSGFDSDAVVRLVQYQYQVQEQARAVGIGLGLQRRDQVPLHITSTSLNAPAARCRAPRY